MFVSTHQPCRPALRVAATVLVLCALGACKKDQAASTDAAAEAPAGQAAAPPPVAVAAQVAALSPEQLREAAGAALREQRLYAPAGNNAMEYYVALRDKQPNDPAVSSALTDLMPYALIATEQSIGRDDFSEAQRLYALMEKTDPQAPALPRLKQSITDAQASLAQRTAAAEQQTEAETQRQAELEKQRAEEQQRAQQQAAQQLAAQQETATRETAQREAAQREAAQREAAQREAAQRTAAQQAAQQPPAAQPASAPATPAAAASSGSNELVVVSQASPRYPPAALRARESGSVQVEFTVGTDGSVTSARVVSANPPRTFDREALAAIKKWRFQPVGSPVTTRRTVAFNPGN